MTPTESRPPERPAVPDADLGALLRRARERRGLDVEELARRLRLEPRIVRMLENDLFEELPAPAFARGYVRGLARELAIDPVPLLAELDNRLSDRTPVLSDFETRAPVQVTSDSHVVRYTTAALVLAMVVLVASWWRTQEHALPVLDTLTGDAPAPPAAPVALADTPPLPYTFTTVTHPDDPFYRAPAAPTPSDQADPNRGARGADLVIAAREDAWVQVLDVNGERLYYNLVRAGNRIEIEGRRPYSLVVGNAPSVNIEFEGRVVDIEAISEEGVARFRLGAAPLAQ